jgi:tetratricopeptide (TPR) repeat protein
VDEHHRLDELRRRVEKDPASIAFAPLAEELRRAGEHDEAVRVCRAGLAYHPTYLSAHVTLGRALIELNQYPDARKEFEYVLLAAPDNLLARKGMNDLAARSMTPVPPTPAAEPPLTPEPPRVPIPAPPPPDPVLEELEGWKARIQADRAQRTGRTP